jgi:hypothetical protein
VPELEVVRVSPKLRQACGYSALAAGFWTSKKSMHTCATLLWTVLQLKDMHQFVDLHRSAMYIIRCEFMASSCHSTKHTSPFGLCREIWICVYSMGTAMAALSVQEAWVGCVYSTY